MKFGLMKRINNPYWVNTSSQGWDQLSVSKRLRGTIRLILNYFSPFNVVEWGQATYDKMRLSIPLSKSLLCVDKYAVWNIQLPILFLHVVIFVSSYDNAFKWMSHDLTGDKSPMVRLTALGFQAQAITSANVNHYLTQCIFRVNEILLTQRKNLWNTKLSVQ